MKGKEAALKKTYSLFSDISAGGSRDSYVVKLYPGSEEQRAWLENIPADDHRVHDTEVGGWVRMRGWVGGRQVWGGWEGEWEGLDMWVGGKVWMWVVGKV